MSSITAIEQIIYLSFIVLLFFVSELHLIGLALLPFRGLEALAGRYGPGAYNSKFYPSVNFNAVGYTTLAEPVVGSTNSGSGITLLLLKVCTLSSIPYTFIRL